MTTQVPQVVKQGWPHNCDSTLSVYSSHKTELSVLDGCILWKSRVPENGRHSVLQELHSAHPGMTKMKALARMYVWWPDLEIVLEESYDYVMHVSSINQTLLQLHSIHGTGHHDHGQNYTYVEYVRPLNCEDHYLLILIDANSKRIEAFPAKSPSSSVTLELLHSVFAQSGLPETMVSDNSSCFVSEEFQTVFEVQWYS